MGPCDAATTDQILDVFYDQVRHTFYRLCVILKVIREVCDIFLLCYTFQVYLT